MLAKYNSKPNKQHLTAAKRVLRYLKGSKNLALTFTNKENSVITSFLKFPLPNTMTALCDANWGPQDQHIPNPHKTYPQIDLFKTRSMSGYLIWCNGPIHWTTKRQTITARSSAEAEIYATDEATKIILYIRHILKDLNLLKIFMPTATNVYNDNAACVCWSSNMTTKGLRHVQIRENAVRESIKCKIIKVLHIEGKINPSDLFTKEDKDSQHYLNLRNLLLTPLDTILVSPSSVTSTVSEGGVVVHTLCT